MICLSTTAACAVRTSYLSYPESHRRNDLESTLKVDLTRYHPDLVAGVEGETVGATGLWSRGSDRFVGVRFPSTTLGVVRHVGVRGGFKYLSYEYTDNAGVIYHFSTSSKTEAEKLAALFEEHKIPVKQVVVK